MYLIPETEKAPIKGQASSIHSELLAPVTASVHYPAEGPPSTAALRVRSLLHEPWETRSRHGARVTSNLKGGN